ncbi:MAG TPA: glycosyltransferase family 1 protein [Candidatus Limnocylindria bacterium]|nr:glycosyltransferase family 1 protein [Candidatus Limnocylindria bacterium]
MLAPIRVAFDAHSIGRRQTGNERYAVELATALSARADVEVFAYVDQGVSWPADSTPAPQLRELRTGIPHLRIPFELPWRARRDGADVLQVSYIGPPVGGPPLVTTVHDVSYEDQPQLFRLPTRLRMQWLVQQSVRRSAAVTAVSEFTRRRLMDLYQLPPDKVHVVYDGVSSHWRPTTPAETAAALAGLHLPERFVFFAGTSHERKNLPRLIAAVAALRAGGHADLGLVLAGPIGAAHDAVEAAITANRAVEWVQRLGYVTDEALRALYGAATAVAYVSLYEGFGLPVVEALASGGTVVASSTTGVREAAGDACVLVDPADVEAIAEGLRAALEDARFREELRGRARAHLARFTWTRAAEAMATVYSGVARR